nr:sensor histidine kinase [Psychromicrobium lacuslunae]
MGTKKSAAEPAAATPTLTILRVLRVTLHVGFAALLAIAVFRLLNKEGQPLRYLLLGLALLLACVYLFGTVREKRFAAAETQSDPRRYSWLWLTVITTLWALLLIGNADFSWLAFPLFFLHLHLLPRALALLSISLITVGVIAAQWGASGLPMPQLAMVLGPLFGAAFSVVTGVAYRALYREAESQRRAADELRRTRAELVASQRQAGALAERERLAREIHDTLAQGFSSIVLVARAVEQSLATDDSDTALDRLRLIGQTAAENLAEARNFVRELSSPQLLNSSLLEALHRLTRQIETSAAARGQQLNCILETDGTPLELPQAYQVTLLRAAQASLGNVIEHAQARRAVLTLAFQDNEVTMDVYDDGIGFDAAAPAAVGRANGTGFGIHSVRERVIALGGAFALESASGGGTVVAIRLGLKKHIEEAR